MCYMQQHRKKGKQYELFGVKNPYFGTTNYKYGNQKSPDKINGSEAKMYLLYGDIWTGLRNSEKKAEAWKAKKAFAWKSILTKEKDYTYKKYGLFPL